MAPVMHDLMPMKHLMTVLVLSLTACSSHPPANTTKPVAPATRPVPERQVLAMANALVSLAGRRRFDVRALARAVEERNSVDICRALTLAPSACEELGARVHTMGRRIDEAGVIGEAASSPRGCSDAYSPCCQASLVLAARTGGSPARIAGLAVLGVLRCRCKHCPHEWLGQVCDAIEGI
jgi:hypothetical protein